MGGVFYKNRRPKMALIHDNMIAIQKDVEPIRKEQENLHQKFKFRGVDDVYNALSGVFVKHEVIILPTVLNYDHEVIRKTDKDGGEKVTLRANVIIKYVFLAKDGSTIDTISCGEGVDYGDYATAIANSNALKQCLLQMFLIPTEDIMDSGGENIVSTDSVKRNDLLNRAIEAAEKITPAQKKKAILAGLSKQNDAFLQAVIDGKV